MDVHEAESADEIDLESSDDKLATESNLKWIEKAKISESLTTETNKSQERNSIIGDNKAILETIGTLIENAKINQPAYVGNKKRA